MNNNYIWIDAAEFGDQGEWKLDTQFSHLMGSAYLLACHVAGRPVENAKTHLIIPKAGRYRVWARTKNWLNPYAPGKFLIKVNGQCKSEALGALPTHDWYWEQAGDFTLEKGTSLVELCDLTGYFARVAALIVTDDIDYIPPRPTLEFTQERARLKGIDLTPEDVGAYDVLVGGAGPGGIPAAIAAARHGAKVLLISSRPIVGGNSSSEAGVGFNGASSRQANAREGGIAEEIVREWVKEGSEGSWTSILEKLLSAEKNITVLYNYFVCGAKKNSDTITSITARHCIDGTFINATASMFIDCTGDGWLGYFAGAKYRLGREANWQFSEEFAPEHADNRTMSGCLMGGCGDLFIETEKVVDYVAPEWVPAFPKGDEYGRNIEGIDFRWWLEASNDIDDLYDAEIARDELFRIILGHFNYLKNLWNEKEKAAKYTLGFMPYFDAKRETRRFIGAYTLTQNDCVNGKTFEDAVSHAGWPIDLHNPKGIYSGTEGPFFSNTHIPLTQIPFGCLYSVNVDNLLFAGRNVSVTHVALGTARVQNTIACMGQAVGTAAAMCTKYKITPAGLSATHMEELRQTLLKDDQFIPGVKNLDEKDLAKQGTVSASSYSEVELYFPFIGIESEGYELDRERATFFARGVDSYVKSVWTKLTNKSDQPKEIVFHLREQADPDGYTSTEDLRVITLTAPPNTSEWFELKLDVTTEKRYLWLWVERASEVWWDTWHMPPLDYTRSERNQRESAFENIRWESHCVLLSEPVIQKANCRPENVINGYSRIQDAEDYCWVSNPSHKLPQWVEITFSEKVRANTIYLTFDSDMSNPALLRCYHDFPPQLVSAYTVSIFDGSRWETIAEITDNYQRRRVHGFAATDVEKARVTVTSTGDNRTARIFEIRLYNE